jgi:hypothetical protein
MAICAYDLALGDLGHKPSQTHGTARESGYVTVFILAQVIELHYVWRMGNATVGTRGLGLDLVDVSPVAVAHLALALYDIFPYRGVAAVAPTGGGALIGCALLRHEGF